ncbi:MAG: hypothetical protein QM610_07255 [Chitinophagaceae bacterium]
MLFKKLFSAAAISSCVLAASCLKNDDSTTTTSSYQDPTLEMSAIDNFADSAGFDMIYASNLTGFKYEVVEVGDTTGKITTATPIGVFKYKVTLLSGTGLDSSYKQTDSLLSVDFTSSSYSVLFQTYAFQYVFINPYIPQKVGTGGHIRFITPSAYAFQTAGYGSVIPSNAPLYYDVYFDSVKSY